MVGSDQKRSTRVAESIRAELMDLMLGGAVRDPGAVGALVSNVVVSDDLRIAKVYVRVLDTDVDKARQRAVVRAFERASGFLRREIGARVRLKYTPELRFFWDDVFDEVQQIEALLSEVREDARDEPADGDDDV